MFKSKNELKYKSKYESEYKSENKSKYIKIALLFSMVVFLTCSISFAADSNGIGSDKSSDSSDSTSIIDSNGLKNSVSSVSNVASVSSSNSVSDDNVDDKSADVDNSKDSNKNSNTNSNNINNTNTSSINTKVSTSSSSASSVSSSSATLKSSNSAVKKPTSLSQSSILVASKSLYDYINKYKKLPSYLTIAGYKFSMSEYMYILSKTITYKYKKVTSSIKVKYDVKNPSKATGNSIKGTVSSKSYYTYAKNIVDFIDKNKQAPNYVNSGLGKIQYQTAIFGLNKVLNYIYGHGKLPTTLSFNVKASHSMNKYLPKYNRDSSGSSSSGSGSSGSSSSGEAAGEITKLSQSAIFTASKGVKSFVLKYGKLPNYVTISGVKFSIPEYMYLVSKAIVLKCLKSSSSVTIKWNVKNPTKPSGVTIKKTVSKSTYYDWAKRTYQYIDKYKTAPNYISSKYGNIQYQTAIYGFARVGAYMASYKAIPTTLTLSVSKTSNLNKYKPSYKRDSTPTPTPTPKPTPSPSYDISTNKNAIWLKGWDMSKVTAAEMDKLISYGIGNIFLEEFVFTAQGESKAKSWIATAASKGINVHIWLPVFSDSGNWINPIQNGKLNQAYFDKVIAKAKKYVAIAGVAGIHLDYLRYPGTAYKYSYSGGSGADAITEFTRQLSAAVKSVKPKAIVSAAVMPETTSNAYYYGQDIPKLGKYLDVIVPMIYEGNYKANNAWIESTSAWFSKNSGGAEIWGGLQSYKSDEDITKLSVSALTADVKSIFAGGADGVALFRWGLLNLFNLLGIK